MESCMDRGDIRHALERRKHVGLYRQQQQQGEAAAGAKADVTKRRRTVEEGLTIFRRLQCSFSHWANSCIDLKTPMGSNSFILPASTPSCQQAAARAIPASRAAFMSLGVSPM